MSRLSDTTTGNDAAKARRKARAVALGRRAFAANAERDDIKGETGAETRMARAEFDRAWLRAIGAEELR